MDDKMASIGERIKSRRKELGLTQMDMKAACGISSGALSSIENGGRTPSAVAFLQIAQALDCSMDWLATGESPNVKNEHLCKYEDELLKGFRELSAEDQEELLDILMVKLRKVKRAADAKSSTLTNTSEDSMVG